MNKDKLSKLINLSKKDVVTLVGAGGKTSLINYIARTNKYNYKVLLTTTTKIYPPNQSLYNEMYMLKDVEDISEYIDNKQNGVVVIGEDINKEEKIVGLKFQDIDKIYKNFDLVLIEGDGSKRKKLKGWNEYEPVVYKKTTKTIGVLDITAYDMKINDENIHRIEEFRKITNIKSDKITIENICDVILNKNGMFKNCLGEKILFINKVENTYYEDIVKQLVNSINLKCNNIKIIYGSIKMQEFKLIVE